MNSTSATINHLAPRQTIVIGVLLILVLIGYGILRYPLIVSEGGVLSLVMPVVLLLLYGIAAVWSTHLPSPARSAALGEGTVFGLMVGVVFIANISVENFSGLSDQFITISTLSFMLLIFLLFALAGWRGSQAAGQVRWGLLAGVWSAMISVLIALLFGFAINFLFTQRLEQNLQASAEYLRSGVQDLETFTFYNTLDSASTHLSEVPIIATVFSTLGGLIGKGFRRDGRNL